MILDDHWHIGTCWDFHEDLLWGIQINNNEEVYIYIYICLLYICSLLHKQGCSQHPGYVWEVKLSMFFLHLWLSCTVPISVGNNPSDNGDLNYW